MPTVRKIAPPTSSASATGNGSGQSHGWRRVRFGDVVRNVDISERKPLENGLERYVGLDHLDSESLHIKRWGLIAEGTSFTRKFTKGQVLFGKRRAYQRKAAVAEFDGICSGDILVFEPANGELIAELLPFIVQSDGFFNHALGTSAGSLSPRTKWRDLADYELALPTHDEQRRIAEILWAADEIIIKLQEGKQRLEDYKQAFLTLAFEPSNEIAKVNRLVSLAKILTYASDGPFGSKLKTEHYTDEGARVIRLQNVGDGAFADNDKAFISSEYYQELSRHALKPGDVIVAGLGDANHIVGRACRIPSDLGSAINKADCFCLRSEGKVLDQEYLMHFLNSAYARKQILQRAQGTTRLRINVSNLKTIQISLPDLEGQSEICAVLRSIDEASHRLSTNIHNHQNLMHCLRNILLIYV